MNIIPPGNHFRLDSELGIWFHDSNRSFDYSDGAEAEREMLEVLRRTEDRSTFSESLKARISGWVTEYHFSSRRHALLRHLNIPSDASVLELGAGCGAITRYLGELGAEVWAIEGTRARAACVAARTHDLPNVRVLCGDFQAIQIDRRFDVVTLIGVLEYAPKFFKSDHPFVDCLKLAHRLLKPDGTLVVAIENQLGLKYFCGAPEDHNGHPFSGIQNLYSAKSTRTCGKVELSSLLKDAGFADIRFEYPFPDYKLPRWILTQRAMELESFDPCPILRSVAPAHMGSITNHPADERRIWPQLYRNGVLPDLANSFLVLAGASGRSRLADPGLLAAGYITERRPCFNIQTRICVDERGEITVHKSHLVRAAAPPKTDLQHQIGVDPYYPGEQFEQQIIQPLQQGDLGAAIAGLKNWIDYIVQNGLIEKDSRDLYASLIIPRFFDCTPRNLIVMDGGLQQIDREWMYTGELPLRYHILRYLRVLASEERRLFRRFLPEKPMIALQLCSLLDVPVSEEAFLEYKLWQQRLDDWLSGRKPSVKLSLWRQILTPASERRRQRIR